MKRIYLITTDSITTKLIPDSVSIEDIIDYGINKWGLDFVGYEYNFEKATQIQRDYNQVFSSMASINDVIYLEKCLEL